jgi:hypothetical protein
MKGKPAPLLPLLHTLVEERAGERRFSNLSAALHEPAMSPLKLAGGGLEFCGGRGQFEALA